MKKITVVGGGFSGMTLALELAKRGFEVDLHEKSHRLGGLIQTRQVNEGLVETAANGFLWTRNLEILCNEIGVQPLKPEQSAARRYFFRHKPKTWPLTILESFVFFPKLIWSLITGKIFASIPEKQTLESWAQQRIGAAGTKYIFSPALQGIYAGDMQKLSASLILSPLLNKKKTGYHGLVSAKNGMQDFIDALETKLKSLDVHIHLSSNYQFEASENPVVFATSAASAAQLTEKFSDLSQLLKRIQMCPLVTVTSFWKKKNSYKGFGCLIPRGLKIRTLGVLMNSYIFAGRDRIYNETFILGGATDLEILKLSDLELHQLVLRERKEIFKSTDELISLHITRWPQALPHYTTELEEILKNIKLPPGIFLHGNYLGKIGLSKILDRSIDLAKEIEAIHG